jgi:hypothetical protein
LKKLLVSILLMASFAVHAQSDISITNITLVGGSNLCPSSSVSVTVTFKNEGATTVAINDDAKLILSNGVVYTETISITLTAGQSSSVILGQGIDLSTPNNYSLTVSFTNPGDIDNSNDVFVLGAIIVNNPIIPSLSNDAGGTLCFGDPITFTITPYSATATYTFYLNSGNKRSFQGTNTITYPSLSDGDVVSYEFVDSNGCSVDTSADTTTVDVEDFTLVLTTNNAGSNNTFVAGSAMEITASSLQASLTYNFSVGATNFKTITAGSGVKTVSFTASGSDLNVLTGQGVLKVTANSGAGICVKDTSIPFTIFDFTPGSIGGSAPVCSGVTPANLTNAALGVSAISSVTFSYVWQTASNITFTQNLLTTTVTSTNFPFSSSVVTTTYFRRKVTASLSGVSSVSYSNVASVTVTQAPTNITLTTDSTGANNTFVSGANPVITAGAAEVGMTYRFSVDSNAPFKTIQAGAGANSVSFTASGTDLLSLNGQGILKVEVYTAAACSSIFSVPFTIFTLTPGSVGDDETICTGAIPQQISQISSATSDITSVTLSYYWQSSTSSTFSIATTTDLTTVTSTHIPFSSNLATTTYFRRAVQGSLSGVTSTIFSASVLKTVTPSPSSVSLISNQAQNTFFYDGTPPDINITATADQAALTYQFSLLGGPPVATQTAAAGVVTSVFDHDFTSAGLYTVHVLAYPGIDTSCAVSSTIDLILFDLTAGTVTGTQDVCLGVTPNTITNIASATSTNASVTLSRYWRATDDLTLGSAFVDFKGSTGLDYSFSTSIPASAYYLRVDVASLNGVTVEKETNGVFVTVVDVQGGTVSPSQAFMCEGNAPNITIVGSHVGPTYSYQWQSSTTNILSASFSNINLATTQSYTPTSTLTQNTFFRRVTTYSATTEACRVAYSSAFTLNVNALNPGSLNGNQSLTYCYGTQPQEIDDQVPASGLLGDLTYTWYYATVIPPSEADWITIPSSNSATYQPPHLLTSTYYRRGAFDSGTSSATSCDAYTDVVSYTLLDDIDTGILGGPAATVYCVGDLQPNLTYTAGENLNANPQLAVLQWQQSSDKITWLNVNSDNGTRNTYVKNTKPVLTQSVYFRARIRYTNVVNGGAAEPEQRLISLIATVNENTITAGETYELIIGNMVSTVTATGAINTLDKVGAALKTKVDAIGGYSAVYDTATNILKIIKATLPFQEISFNVIKSDTGAKTVDGKVIHTNVTNANCDVYTPILSIIVVDPPTFNADNSGQSVCDTTTPIVPVSFSWSGPIDIMNITHVGTLNSTFTGVSTATATGVQVSGATTITFTGTIAASTNIVFTATGICGTDVMFTYPISLEQNVAAPTAIRKDTDSSLNTVHYQGGKGFYNTVYVSSVSGTLNQDFTNFHVCPDVSLSNIALNAYVWSLTPPGAGVITTAGVAGEQVQVNWNDSYFGGATGTGTTVTLSVQSQSKCNSLSASLDTIIYLIDADTVTDTTPVLSSPVVTNAKCGYYWNTLLAVPSCEIFDPIGSGGVHPTNKIQFFSASTSVNNEFKTLEWSLDVSPGAGSNGVPTITSPLGVMTLPAGFHGTIEVKVRAIGFNGETGNWATSQHTVSPIDEIIPSIQPFTLPDCPIPATGITTSTLVSDRAVHWYVSTTNVLAPGSFQTVTGSTDGSGYQEIMADATTSKTLDLVWKPGLAGGNQLFIHAEPQNCSRYVRNYIILIPQVPDIFLSADQAGLDSQEICENTTLLTDVTFDVRGRSVDNVNITGPPGFESALSATITRQSQTATITLGGANNTSQGYYYVTINSNDIPYLSATNQTVDNLGNALAPLVQNHNLIDNAVYNAATNQLVITGELGKSFSIVVSTPTTGGITITQDANGNVSLLKVKLTQLDETLPVGTNYQFNITTTHPANSICVSDTQIFYLDVLADSELTLSSSATTENQVFCFDSSFEDIVYEVAGNPTAINTTGLPEGFTKVYLAGGVTPTYTIAAGAATDYWTERVFNYSISTFQNTQNCSEDNESGTITIKPAGFLSLSSTTSISQFICEGDAIAPVAYEYWGDTTLTTFLNDTQGLGGLSAAFTSQVQVSQIDVNNPAVTENASATFNVTVNDVTYSHEVATNGTTVVQVLTALKALIDAGSTAAIVQSTVSGTTLVFTGQTSGVTFDIGMKTSSATILFADKEMLKGPKVITITGTPTIDVVTDTLTFFQVSTLNGCDIKTLNFPVTLYVNNKLSAIGGTLTDSVCANNSMTPITFSAEGGNTIFISVSPTIAGFAENITLIGTTTFTINKAVPTNVTTTTVYTYTVTLTGNPNACSTDFTVTGTITVEPNHNIDLTSAAGTDVQSAICQNTQIVTITYQFDEGATGLNSAWDNNIIPQGLTITTSGTTLTISGTATSDVSTPTTYSYTVTTTGNTCATDTVTGSITVLPLQKIKLTSAANTDSQTICEQTSITDIQYTISDGATSAAFTWNTANPGLTAGISGTVLTISGTTNLNLTSAQVYGYTITTNGNTCSAAVATGTITVLPDHQISLKVGSNKDQSICENTAIATITYTLSEGATDFATPVWTTALGPATLPGVNITLVGSEVVIAGTPTTDVPTDTTYIYTILTTGLNTCVAKTVTGSIELLADHQISLDTANNNQSVCENTAIATITYTLTEGATSFTTPVWTKEGVVSTLNGVNITLVGSQVVIAGTPTTNVTTNTTYIFSISTQGTTGFGGAPCGAKTVTGSIVLLPDHQISLLSGSNDQSICENTAIATITYNLSEGANNFTTPIWTIGGVATTLPGVNISLVGSQIVIAGTPTTNVTTDTTYIYTISSAGTAGLGAISCGAKTVTGSIELSADHQINLDTANKDQSICENTAIATITYTLSEGATGFVNPPTWTSGGVPITLTGVNISLVGSQVVIAGTPTLNVTTDTTYIYSVVTAGTTGFAAASCGAKTVTGSIELLADHQISLLSGSNDQLICESTAIATITYTLSEGATDFELPVWTTPFGAGPISSDISFTLSGTLLIISGTPLANVSTDTTYGYSVATKGSGANNCAFETVTGSITLSADHEISLATANDNQSVCTNSAITPITYTLGGGAENISASITPFTPGLSIFTTIGNQTTLSGTPTLSVTTPTVLIYTIITRGTQIQPNVYCNSKTVTGTITILPDHDLSLKSGQLSQTYCVGTNIDPIEIDMLGGTTSYTIAYNLALNLTHTISGSVITIGGSTPSFVTTDTSYTVTLTSIGNSCVTDTITATINVVIAPTLSLTSSASTEDQSVCNKTSIATITYKMDNGVSTYFLSGQPNGIVPTETNGVISISGKPDVAITVPTSYRYKLVTTNSTSCADVAQYGFIVVKPEPILNIKNQAATERSITREVCAEQFFNPVVIEFSGFHRPRLLAGSSLPSGINSPTIAITQQQESSVVVSGTSITASQTFYVSVFVVNNGANAQFSYTTIAPNENATTIAQGLLNSMAGSTVVSSTLNGSTIEMIAQDNEDLFEVRMYSSPESNLLTPGISLPLRGELTLTGTPTASVTSGTFIANVGEDSSDYCIDYQIVVTLKVEGVSFINIINPAEADLDICDNTSHLINFEYGGTATGAFQSDVVWKDNLEPSAFSMTSSGTTVSGTTLFELSVTASENVTTTTTYEYTIITSGSDCEEGTFTGEINVFPSEYIAHIAATASFTGTSAFPQGDEIQVICDGSPIVAPIKYEFWGSSDSYTLTWGGGGAAPLGVILVPGIGTTSGSFTITISGTLNTGVTTTTTYTYTIATVGSNLGGPDCDSFSRVGSLEVRPLSRMSLFSPGLDQQTGNNAICNRSDILDITYLIGGGVIDVNIPPSTVGASTINFSKDFDIATGQVVVGATVNTTVTQTTTFPYTITTINRFTCAPEVTLTGQIEVHPDVVVNQAFITANDISDVTCFGASDGSIIIPQTPLSEFEKRIVGGQQNIRQIDQLSLLTSATLNAGDVVQVTINGAVFQGVVPVGATTSTILQELLVKINSNNPADVPVTATIVSGTLLNLIADVGGVPFTSAGQTITSSVTGTTLITNLTANRTISYSFNWTGPNGFTSTALNINNLDSGDYTLAVTANGCSSNPPTYGFTVGGPVAALALDVIGCSGSMNVTPSGGNAPYVISVYQVGLTTNTLLQVQPTNGAIQFNGLTAGQNYIIQLLDSTCAISEDLAYKMPFDILIDPSKVTLTHDVCNESPTNLGGGSIVLSNNIPVTGGSGNYSYQWAGVTNAGVTNVYTSQDITNILPGSYTLTVTDLELGCTSNKTFNILTPTAVTAGPTNQTSLMETNWYPSFATATATTVTGTIDALILLNCQQDFADMEVQIIGNGTNGNSAVISTTVIGTYAVNWLKNGSAMTALNPRFKIEDQGPGVYEARVSLTGVGIANCSVDTYRFEVRKAEVLTAVEVVNERIEAPCSGNFASLTFQVSGGSSVGGQYTISLNNGLYVTSSNSTTIVIPQIDPLELNTIDTITISDNSGCDPVTEDIADIILSIPEDVEIDVAQIVDVDCLNDQLGSITLGVTKGTFNDVGQIQVIWKSDLTDPTKAGSTQFLNWDMTGVTDNKGLAVANGTLPDIKFAGKYTYEVKSGNASNTCILAAGEVDVVSQDLSQLTLSEVIITQPGCAATLGRIDLVIDVNTIIGGLEIVWEEFVTDLSVSATGTTTTASTTTSSNTTTQIWKEITGFKNQTVATDLPNGVYRPIISDDRGISLNANCPSGPIRTNSISIANTGIQISNLALTEIVPADCTNLADITTTLQFSISSNLPNPGANQHFFEYNILGDKLGSIAHSVNGNAAGIIVVPPNTWDGKYTITGLLPDRYTLSVSEQTTAAASGTAAVLCEDFYSFEINEFTPMTYAGDTSFVIDPCSDEVEITANITGGVPFSINGSLVYDYQWTLRPTSADGTPLGLERNYIGKSITLTEEGSLELKVTDSRGCYIEPTSALNLGNFTIAFENRALQITPELSTSSSTLAIDKVYSIPPTCNGGVPNGQIAFTINEGAAPYDIIWMKQIAGTTASSTNAGYQEILEYKGTKSQNGLESGDYRIIVRSQYQPCGNTPSTYLEKDISVEQNKDLYFLTDPVVNSDLCLSLPGQIVVQLYDNQKGAVSFFYGTEKLISQTDDNETYIVDVPNPVISETLYVRNSADCEISQKINIGVGSPAFSINSISLSQSKPILAREEITFENNSTEPWVIEKWIFGDNSPAITRDRRTDPIDPIRKSYGIAGTFFATLRISNAIGCDVEITKPIVVGVGYSILMPNVFTPNDDGDNEAFKPIFSGLKSMDFTVYDSRGNLLWTKSYEEAIPGNGMDEIEDDDGFQGLDGNGSPYYIYTISGKSLFGDIDIDKSGTFIIIK